MYSLIEMYLQDKKRIYCAFIDYTKAFDLIDRSHLWSKLLDTGINGKIFTVIHNLYKNAKSCVKYCGVTSKSHFCCNIGVRQGESLSPLLFAIYVNDFKTTLSEHCQGLTHVQNHYEAFCNDANMTTMFKLFTLLYADDTVVMAESAQELQVALDTVFQYCLDWKLTVNISKTKIIIFSRGKVRIRPVFKFGQEVIEIIDDYKYLGCTLNYNGKFTKNIKERVNAARRAMFNMMKNVSELNLPLDLISELFDSLVTPVLLYGCEVWGIENIDMIENFHVKFCKQLLKLNKSTANCMALGELGRLKLKRDIDKRIVNYWCKLLEPNTDKISTLVYTLSKSMYDANIYKSKWLGYVKSLLDNCGYSNLWNCANINNCNLKWVKASLHHKIDDIARQEWRSEVSSNKLCINYRVFKPEFGFCEYLNLLDTNNRITLCKFRCGNNNLPVTKGRYEGIHRDARICTKCNDGSVGDEFHSLYECQAFNVERQLLLKRYYITRPNALKTSQLFTSKSKGTLRKLSELAMKIMACH